MASDTVSVAFGLAWAVLLVIATAAIAVSSYGFLRSRFDPGTVSPAGVFCLAFVVRLVPCVMLNHGANYDIDSYRLIGTLVLQNIDVYTSALANNHYPYLPPDMYLSAAVLQIAQWTQLPFVILVKLPFSAADAAIAAVITAGLPRYGVLRSRAVLAGLAYALNPVAVMICSYHGQFDSMPLLCCVLAWYVLGRDRYSQRAAMIVGIAVGAAVLLKTWPAILAVAFLVKVKGRMRKLLYCIFVAAIPLAGTGLYVLFHHTPMQALQDRVLGYQSVLAWWGVGWFLPRLDQHHVLQPLLPHAARLLEVLTLAAIMAYCWIARRRSLASLCAVCVLVFYALAPGFSVQYLVWVIPFLTIASSRFSLTIVGCSLNPLVFLFALWSTVALGFIYLSIVMYPVIPLDAGFRYYPDFFFPVYFLGLLLIPALVSKRRVLSSAPLQQDCYVPATPART